MKATLYRKKGTKYQVITVKEDGFPQRLGRSLLENFNTPEKVDALFEAGDQDRVKSGVEKSRNPAKLKTKTEINASIKAKESRHYYRYENGAWEILKTGSETDWVKLEKE